MNYSTTINLQKSFFREKEKVLILNESMSASTFIFESGVYGLRIKNKCGEIVMLPYQGQQVWSCNFHGRELAMRSAFTEPVLTSEYLKTYGGFLLHCGATAMGVPAKGDHHPLHGDLPNAPYQRAFIETGKDNKGNFIALGGQYHHIVSFNHNYLAEPMVKLYEDSTVIDVSMKITNLKNTDMELMYLMHVNFRPVDNGVLVYSANCNPNDVRVHAETPTHIKTGPNVGKLSEFLNLLVDHPEHHNVLKPELVFDPEILFTIKYKTDENGYAHSMQVHPDDFASYISHRTSELDYGLRWIARTKNEDALGIVLPATAEHKGYSAEKEKGHIKNISAGKTVEFKVQAGLLIPSEAEKMKAKINSILEDKK